MILGTFIVGKMSFQMLLRVDGMSSHYAIYCIAIGI